MYTMYIRPADAKTLYEFFSYLTPALRVAVRLSLLLDIEVMINNFDKVVIRKNQKEYIFTPVEGVNVFGILIENQFISLRHKEVGMEKLIETLVNLINK